MNRYEIIYYDTKKYDFEKLLKTLFDVRSLSNLHYLCGDDDYKEQFEVGKDSSTNLHKMFYDKYREGWGEMQSLYDLFILHVASKKFDEDFLYQAFPTIRFHIPNNVAVGAFHNDAEYHHPKFEMNFIIPLTNSFDTASVWVESEPGKKDFEPIPLKQGMLVMFNGNELTHGNKKNDTGKTRVSMDFRILPLSKYNENNESGSMTMNTKFKEGEYYKRFKK